MGRALEKDCRSGLFLAESRLRLRYFFLQTLKMEDEFAVRPSLEYHRQSGDSRDG